jgi:TRAP-type C4-dicarboxylate transport system permease small subunit
MSADQRLDLADDRLYDRIVTAIPTVIFSLTILLAMTQAIVRKFDIGALGSLSWTTTAAGALLIVGTYIGAAVAARNEEQIKMNYALDKLEARRPATRKGLEIVDKIIVIGFSAIVLRGTIQAAYQGWNTAFGGIELITLGPIYAGMSVGFSLLITYEFRNLTMIIKSEHDQNSIGSSEPESRDEET